MLHKDIYKNIIKPGLESVFGANPSADILVYGTGMVETGYNYLTQIGKPENGGIGFFQIQPSDYKDIQIWVRNGFVKGLFDRLLATCYYSAWPQDVRVLAHNIKFSALICRTHYYRIKEPLPKPTEARQLAEYHKRFYNGGALGKADVDRNTDIFEAIIHDNK